MILLINNILYKKILILFLLGMKTNYVNFSILNHLILWIQVIK